MTPESQIISLSTSGSLFFQADDIGNAPVATVLGLVPPLAGYTPAVGELTFTGSYVTPTGSGTTPSAPATTTYTAFNSTHEDGRSNSVTLSIEGLSSTSGFSCSFASPYSSLGCLAGGITLSNDNISSSGSLNFSGSLSGDYEYNLTSSNSPSVKSVTLKQISNTRNNQALDDDNQYLPCFLNNKFYFNSSNNNGALKLHSYDWTNNTIQQVSNTYNDNTQSENPYCMLSTSSYLIFRGYNRNGELKLFKFDGSSIEQVSNFVNSQVASDIPGDWTGEYALVGGYYYFNMYNQNGVTKLFRTNDFSTFQQVSNTRENQSQDDTPQYVFLLGDVVYFTANNSNGVEKLFKFENESVYKFSNTSENLATTDSPHCFKEFNNELFFIANNSNGVEKLYKTNGATITQISNTSGNQAVADEIECVDVGANYYGNLSLVELDGYLYFWAHNSSAAYKIFRTDGSTVEQVSNMKANNVDDVASAPTNYFGFSLGPKIYTFLKNENNVNKLMSFDGRNFVQVSNSSGDNTITDDPLVLKIWHPSEEYHYIYLKNVNGKFKLHRIDSDGNITFVGNIINDTNDDDTGLYFSIFSLNDHVFLPLHVSDGISKMFYICESTTDCQ